MPSFHICEMEVKSGHAYGRLSISEVGCHPTKNQKIYVHSRQELDSQSKKIKEDDPGDIKDVFIPSKTPYRNHAQEGDPANVAKYY